MENLLKYQEIITIQQETYYRDKETKALYNKLVLQENLKRNQQKIF